MKDLTHALTQPELDYLAECEERIERGLQTFVEVGTALAMIRDNKLYRAEHRTFADYCEARWSIGRAHAYRMIDAAQAVSPIGDTGMPLPSNEAQARELARVPEPDRVGVWAKAREATDGRPTAAAIRAAAQGPEEVEPVVGPTGPADSEADAQLDAAGLPAGARKAEEVSHTSEAGDGTGASGHAPVPQTSAGTPADAGGEEPSDLPAAGAPAPPVGAPVTPADTRARDVVSALVSLADGLGSDPVDFLIAWRPDAHPDRGLPAVEEALSLAGLRLIADRLHELADYLDKTDGAL